LLGDLLLGEDFLGFVSSKLQVIFCLERIFLNLEDFGWDLEEDFNHDCLLGDLLLGEDFLEFIEVSCRLLRPGILMISDGI
jgi:hypothetical protein